MRVEGRLLYRFERGRAEHLLGSHAGFTRTRSLNMISARPAFPQLGHSLQEERRPLHISNQIMEDVGGVLVGGEKTFNR